VDDHASQMSTEIRVVLADDHPIIQTAVSALLHTRAHWRVVGCATNGADALQLVTDHAPHLLVLDVSMPGIPIADVLMQLRERPAPRPRVLLFTSYGSARFIQDMVRLGAHGYMLKEEQLELLLAGLDVLLAGKQWHSPAVVRLLNARLLNAEAPEGRGSPDLTRRDIQLLQALGQGWNDAQIAREIGLARKTVKNNLSELYARLNVESRLAAVVWARQHGLIQ